MNRQEAEFLLRAYRLGGQDANDPQFREALQMVKHDPELAEWFAAERNFDIRLQAKILDASKPPADLKRMILASAKVAQATRWWKRPVWAAAAALFIVIMSVAVLWLREPSRIELAAFRTDMEQFLNGRVTPLDLETRDLVAIREWLQKQEGHSDFVVPAGLNGLPTMGCRVLEWRGRKVSFVCFELENRQMIHLFVVDRSALENPPGENQRVITRDGWATRIWSRGDKIYLAAAEDEISLRKHL